MSDTFTTKNMWKQIIIWNNDNRWGSTCWVASKKKPSSVRQSCDDWTRGRANGKNLFIFFFLIFNYNLLAAVFVHRTLCAETRQSVLCNQAWKTAGLVHPGCSSLTRMAENAMRLRFITAQIRVIVVVCAKVMQFCKDWLRSRMWEIGGIWSSSVNPI